MKSVERETQLYKTLVDSVLAKNMQIRDLIGSNKCVERTLKPKMQVFIEKTESSIKYV